MLYYLRTNPPLATTHGEKVSLGRVVPAAGRGSLEPNG